MGRQQRKKDAERGAGSGVSLWWQPSLTLWVSGGFRLCSQGLSRLLILRPDETVPPKVIVLEGVSRRDTGTKGLRKLWRERRGWIEEPCWKGFQASEH